MTGWKDWQIGEVVTESDFQNLVQDQVVQRYADASARSTTLGTAVAEGMVSYLESTSKVEVYDGSSWVQVGQEGDITSVTAGTGLTGGGTAGDVTLSADYAAIGSAVSITASQVTDLTASAAAINTIDDGTAGYTALSNGTAGLTYQPVSHNYLINGAFDVWQRGTSQTTTGFGSADRWYHSIGGTTTVSRSTDIPTGIGVQYSSKWETGASSSFGQFYTALERDDVIPMRGKQMTFSFYVKSAGSMAGNIAPTATYSNSTDALVSVTTAVSATGDTSFGASTVTSWTRKQIVFTVPSDAVGLRLQVLPGTVQASGVSCLLTGVQLEAGSVATPFKRHAPSLQGELAACQRYFYKADFSSNTGALGVTFSSSAAGFYLKLPITMRAAPSLVFSGSFAANEPGVGSRTFTGGAGTGKVDSVDFEFTGSSGLTAGRLVVANGGVMECRSEL